MRFHWKHKWEAVAAVNRSQPVATELTRITGEFVQGVIVPKTDILYRCVCGVVRSDEISGFWTLQQITAASLPKKEGE